MSSGKVIKSIHYTPTDGYLGDPIPFWHNGTWHVFYLKLKFDNTISWGHAATEDFICWQEYEDALCNGEKGSLDEFTCGTGSIVSKDNIFHLFYTGGGINGYNILKATSTDLIHWEKEYRILISGGEQWYRQDRLWRDPCVFWNPEENKWWMSFCARTPAGNNNFMPGAIGLAESDDLNTWHLRKPLWAERIGGWIECPDIFQYEDIWVLCYYWRETVFRYSKSPKGPWQRSGIEAPAGYEFSAGKTATDGHRRLGFGWIPRKTSNCSLKLYGGVLAIPRELGICKDRSPAVHCPPEVEYAFSRDATDGLGARILQPLSGNCNIGENTIRLSSRSSCTLLYWEKSPANYCLGFTVEFIGTPGTVSLYLRTAHAPFAGSISATPIDTGYELLLDAYSMCISLREHCEYNQIPDITTQFYDFSTSVKHECRVFIYDQVIEVFIGKQRSLTARLLKHRAGGLGLAGRDSSIALEEFFIRTLIKPEEND